jgi:GT2 family glycosyltransferase
MCIITDNQEPDKLQALYASIHKQKMDCEIIVSVDKDRTGRLGLLRNKACAKAAGEVLIVLDDDMVLHDDFSTGLQRYGNDFDVLSCRILNPDYTRYWDWKAHKDGLNWLLDYGDKSPLVSVTGGLCIMRRWVWDVVKWDSERGFYQNEDVDFSERLKAKNIRIDINPYSTVTHNAPYTQRGRGVYKIGE